MAWSCGKSGCPTHARPEHPCKCWALAPLTGSVGTGGKNAKNDVVAVQGALNRCLGPAGPSAHIATDRVATPALVDLLKRFQRYALGSKKPDGSVDPGGVSNRALGATCSGSTANRRHLDAQGRSMGGRGLRNV